ncbi:MAG: type II secretion system protein GspG [Verrucomicrobia bacterium]|nr:type II secretion system protein GspG [Verrucomicrobiota bacterium]
MQRSAKTKYWIGSLTITLTFIGVIFVRALDDPFPWGISTSEVAELFTKEAMPKVLDRFHRDMDRYPTTAEGLPSLFRHPQSEDRARWKGPYMEGGRLSLDPWGRTYQYRCPGWMNPKGYDVWSLGPDGVVSADDIGNWPENRLR